MDWKEFFKPTKGKLLLAFVLLVIGGRLTFWPFWVILVISPLLHETGIGFVLGIAWLYTLASFGAWIFNGRKQTRRRKR